MKLLLKQQKEILQLFYGSAGATESDLIAAINQHLTTVANNNNLLPFVSGEKRECCKNNKCVNTTIDFKTIDGCFCEHCGYVFPF